MSALTEPQPQTVRQKRGWIGPTPQVPMAGRIQTQFGWSGVEIPDPNVPHRYVENEMTARLDARDTHTVIVDPVLQQKLRRHGDDVHRRIHQVRPDVWLCGESQIGAGVPVGQSHVFRRSIDEWRIVTGEPTLSKPTDEEWKAMSQSDKLKYRKESYDSRPFILISAVTEYGSTRINYSSDGWDRYIVVYEQGTLSPYPFAVDDTRPWF